MNLKHWVLLGLAGSVFLGCPKKPPAVPPAEPAPPKVEAPPPPPPPREDEAALRRQRIQARIAETFKPVYFAYDQSSLTSESRSTCDRIASLMREVPEITVRIEGHADERGTNEYNLALGDRRAKAVEAYLVSYGIAGSRLSTLSYGEERPAVEGQNEAAWSKNRRDEFVPSF